MANAHDGVIEVFCSALALWSQANHTFGAAAALRRSFTHPGRKKPLGLKAIYRGVERSDGTASRGDSFNVFTDRSAVGIVAKGRSRSEEDVFKLSDH